MREPTVESESTRVASLAPSATATLDAMGAADRLVGVTAHCEFDAPVVGGWLNPDYDRLAELDPDLVCTSDALQSDVRGELTARGYEVCHVEPARLTDVLDSFETLGAAVGRSGAGAALAADCRERLAAVEARTPDGPGPVVYCEEWSDPPMAAGNWVPDAVAAAGGRCPFVDAGDRSREIDREAVERADPDHVVLHLCGRGDRVSPESFRERGWDVDAAVHVLDDSLLNQPSPRLVDGVETLAELLRPASDA
ncbi:Fe3+-hydroxamate ABC transporter substrate-binding protein [Halogeometricum pallidum JCM 14848]|uniref:Fe3+-hydroxamate ABC transporter substrate-binding protein n=1 Tax=Halogeometricum pallidum JCM 14848 TaxID=1227487 RepID=M0CVK4_HALPD|nr:cobalamin-binding protein [Halogeometricum pallidum]ELZ27250.1 Fe3+-hydroxamate ABC transporter substrate-binding protein [Halogeometricum pallidum JCM 14848]